MKCWTGITGIDNTGHSKLTSTQFEHPLLLTHIGGITKLLNNTVLWDQHNLTSLSLFSSPYFKGHLYQNSQRTRTVLQSTVAKKESSFWNTIFRYISQLQLTWNWPSVKLILKHSSVKILISGKNVKKIEIQWINIDDNMIISSN